MGALLEHAGPVLAWVLAALGSLLLTKVIVRIPFEWARGIATRAIEAIRTIVLAVHQTYVEARVRAADPTSPGGASITDAEAKAARDLAWEKFRAMGVSKALPLALFLLGAGKRDDWFATQLEAAVYDRKLLEKAVTSSSAPLTTAALTTPAPAPATVPPPLG